MTNRSGSGTESTRSGTNGVQDTVFRRYHRFRDFRPFLHDTKQAVTSMTQPLRCPENFSCGTLRSPPSGNDPFSAATLPGENRASRALFHDPVDVDTGVINGIDQEKSDVSPFPMVSSCSREISGVSPQIGARLRTCSTPSINSTSYVRGFDVQAERRNTSPHVTKRGRYISSPWLRTDSIRSLIQYMNG